MSPADEIKNLNSGEYWIWPESDYGKAEIWRKHNSYFLFEIPLYGGLPSFKKEYSVTDLDSLIKDVEAWT